MGRVYTVSAGGQTLVNGVVTLVFLNPSSTIGFKVRRIWIGQSANATSVQQRVQLVSQVTAFPTLASATPRAHALGGQGSGLTGGTSGAAGTAGVNASAEGAGAKTVRLEDSFNVVNGWLYVPTEAELWEFGAGAVAGFGLYLPVAALTLTNWNFGITFEELG